ncbi:MAG TPA: hypothetical protein VG347_04705 [Verrucomicrobiae bacterium]|nr:hypothetical protein [Verrucomicrobiae bacterium]
MTENEIRYEAFLSYSQQDNRAQRPDASGADHICWGDWLHQELKAFSVPSDFAGQPNARAEIVPARIAPIFQDTEEQSDSASLSDTVRQALERSKYLIIICSPRSAASLHVNEVVRYFKQLGRANRILSIVIAGEPNAGDATRPGISLNDECFCPALRHPLKPDGTIDTSRERGSIFADARHGDAKKEITVTDRQNGEIELETGKIQLIAGLLGVGFNGLWGHELKRHFAETQTGVREPQPQIQEVVTPAPAIHPIDSEAQSQLAAAQQQIQELRNQAHTAQEKVLEAQNQAREAVGQLTEARTQVQSAEAKVLEAQDVARAAQTQLEESRAQVREAQNKVLEVQNLPQDVKSQIQEAQNQTLEIQNQLRSAQGQTEEFRTVAREAQNRLAEAQNQAREIQNQVQEIEAKARETQNQLEEARNQSRVAESKVQTAQQQAREAQNQTEAARQQIREAESKIEELQNQNRDALNQTRDAQSQLQAAQSRVLEVQNQTRATQNQAQESETKVQAARRLTKVFAVLAVLALMAAGIALSQRKQVIPSPATTVASAPDLATNTLTQEQIQQALQKVAGAGLDEDQLHSLNELADQIPVPEIPATLNASSVILVDPQLNDLRGYFQRQLLDTWTKTNASAAFDWSCQLTNITFRQSALEATVPAIAAANPTNTLARLNGLKPVPGESAYTALFQSWAAQDPQSAIDQRQQIPDHDAGGQVLSAILATWAGQKPDAAVNWLETQPDSAALPAGTWRNLMIADLFDVWSAKDINAATTACQLLPEGIAKEKAWEAVLAQRIQKDPASAAQYVTNLPAGDARQTAIEALCTSWDDTNALAWAQSLPATTERNSATDRVVANVATKDPQTASQLAARLPDLSDAVLTKIATTWFQRDFSAATNWGISLPDSDRKATVMQSFAEPWAQNDPKGLAAFAFSFPAGEMQAQYLTAASSQLAIHDLPGAVELLQPLTDTDQRQTILEKAAQNCDVPQLDAAAKYAAAMPAGDDQKAVIKGLLATWTQADPAAAVNWLGSFPETNAQPELVQSVVKSWSQTEPATVAKWLTNSSFATINDGIVNAFLEGATAKYPDFAAQWTASVTDETKRQYYQAQVARQWLKTDPSSAQKWIDTLNLPDAIKQSLKDPAP